MRSRGFATAAALVGGLVAALLVARRPEPGPAGLPGSSSTPERPNVVLILVDALRADRLGCYGHDGGLSPAIDQLASEGAVFEQAIAQAPWTQPSVASLMTSTYPGVHGVVDYAVAYRSVHEGTGEVAVLGADFVTLPEMLRAAGYTTAAFVANPFVLEEFGFGQGFDHFDAGFAMNTTPGSVVNDAFFEWLERRPSDQPFFAFLHYMDVHGPYDARPELLEPLLDRVEASTGRRRLTQDEQKRLGYLARLPTAYGDRRRHERLGVFREYWVARYDAGVRAFDEVLRALRDALASSGLLDESYLILTADHGEALLEHGHWDHGRSLHQPELRVPLVLRWPGRLDGGQRIPATVQLVDLMPTIAQQLSVVPPAPQQGRSLVGLLEGATDEGSAFAGAVKWGPAQQALYQGRWKLMAKPERGEVKLFDLARDPLESVDVSGLHRERVAAMTASLVRQQALDGERARASSVESIEASEEVLERLRALGYVD